MSLEELDSRQRLALMKFVCSFAWADLEIRPEEREFVARMVERLALGPEESQQVKGWLEVPPSPDSIDPGRIPTEHRGLFLEAIEGVIRADGIIAPEEHDSLAILKELFA